MPAGGEGTVVRSYASGTVHALSGGWELERPVELTFPDGRWTIIVRSSKFHVLLESAPIQDQATFSNEVVSVVQGLLDALGFHLAAALRAELSSIVVDGRTLVLRELTWPDLRENPGDPLYVEASTLEPYLKACVENTTVRHALADLRSALEYPDDTAFYAYRAIESVRQWFVEGDADDDAARRRPWTKLQETLEISRERLDLVSALAKLRRHGGTGVLTEAQRLQVLRVARDVLHRFVSRLHAPNAVASDDKPPPTVASK